MKLLIKPFIMLTMVSCVTNKSIGTIYKVIHSVLESLVRAGNVEGLKYTLSKMRDVKIEVNETTADGATPLCMASERGHKEVVEVLLKEGADIDKAQNDGRTPLFIASQNGHKEVVEVLLKAGADKDKAQNEEATPLHIASQKSSRGIIERRS